MPFGEVSSPSSSNRGTLRYFGSTHASGASPRVPPNDTAAGIQQHAGVGIGPRGESLRWVSTIQKRSRGNAGTEDRPRIVGSGARGVARARSGARPRRGRTSLPRGPGCRARELGRAPLPQDQATAKRAHRGRAPESRARYPGPRRERHPRQTLIAATLARNRRRIGRNGTRIKQRRCVPSMGIGPGPWPRPIRAAWCSFSYRSLRCRR
jgi:hypothetical protein